MKTQDYIIINNFFTYEKIPLDLLSGKKIITTNIVLSSKLMSSGTEHINLWEYLTNEIIEKSEILTNDSMNKILQFDSSKLNYKNVPVFDISTTYLRNFFKSFYHTVFTLEKFHSNHKMGKVYVNSGDKIPLNVAGYDSTHLLDAFTELFFKNKGIDVLHYQAKHENRLTYAYTKKFNIDFTEFDYNKPGNEIKNNILFILSLNFEWDFDLVRYIKENGSLRTCVVWRIASIEKSENENKYPLFFHDFEIIDKETLDYNSKIDFAKNKFINEFAQNLFVGYKIYDCLNFQFADFFDKLKKIILDLKTFDNILNFTQPEKVYLSNSWDMSVRCMAKRAMDLGYESYVSVHGGIVDKAGYITRAFEVNNYLIWGQDNYNGFLKVGQNPDSLKVVGSMQMEYWENKINEFNSDKRYNEKNKYAFYNFDSSEIKRSDKFAVTFFTSCGSGFSGHHINEFRHISTLNKIKELAFRNPDIIFRIKPHVVFDYPDFWIEFRKYLPGNLEIIDEADLLKACIELDLAVLVNTISNVTSEISFAGKPVIFLKDACYIADCAESGIERGDVLCLNSFEEFEKYLKEFIESDDLKNDLELRRKRFLSHNFIDNELSARQRILELLMKHSGKYSHNNNKSINDIFNIIAWIREFVRTGKKNKFPDIQNPAYIPEKSFMTSWIYKLTENWCIYYGKKEKLTQYYIKILFSIPSQYSISNIKKYKSVIYSKARDFYLKHKLNESKFSEYIRKKRILIEK